MRFGLVITGWLLAVPPPGANSRNPFSDAVAHNRTRRQGCPSCFCTYDPSLNSCFEACRCGNSCSSSACQAFGSNPTRPPTRRPTGRPTPPPTPRPTPPPTRRPTGRPTPPPTPRPTTTSPTPEPSVTPSRHACSDGTHGCDATEYGICEQIDAGAGHRCSCVATHHCSDGDCATPGHTCEWSTASPTAPPTALSASPTGAPSDEPVPTPSPTAQPSESPTTPTPTMSPTAQPSEAPTTSTPTASPTAPTAAPTASPTQQPTTPPSAAPTPAPTAFDPCTEHLCSADCDGTLTSADGTSHACGWDNTDPPACRTGAVTTAQERSDRLASVPGGCPALASAEQTDSSPSTEVYLIVAIAVSFGIIGLVYGALGKRSTSTTPGRARERGAATTNSTYEAGHPMMPVSTFASMATLARGVDSMQNGMALPTGSAIGKNPTYAEPTNPTYAEPTDGTEVPVPAATPADAIDYRTPAAATAGVYDFPGTGNVYTGFEDPDAGSDLQFMAAAASQAVPVEEVSTTFTTDDGNEIEL